MSDFQIIKQPLPRQKQKNNRDPQALRARLDEVNGLQRGDIPAALQRAATRRAGRAMGANPAIWLASIRPIPVGALIVEFMNHAGDWMRVADGDGLR